MRTRFFVLVIVAGLLALATFGYVDEEQPIASIPPGWPVVGWAERNDLPRAAEPGARVFGDVGCMTCHTYLGEGSRNLRAPDLTTEGCRRRGVEWQVRHLERPASGVHAERVLWARRLGDARTRDLARFLDASRGPGGACARK